MDHFKTFKATVIGEVHAGAIAMALLARSAWFSVEPMPDDAFEITVKAELQAFLTEHLTALSQPVEPAGNEKKHYLGVLKETNGEYTYKHLMRFVSDTDPEKALDDIASGFYGEGTKDGECYFHHGGQVCVEPMSVTQISPELYEQLRTILV